jgi:hypothetical protein
MCCFDSVLGFYPAPVPLCPPQIPHDLTPKSFKILHSTVDDDVLASHLAQLDDFNAVSPTDLRQ